MASSWYSAGMVWLIVFLPAFSYYVSTRMFYQSGLFGAVELGTPISDTVSCIDVINEYKDMRQEKEATIAISGPLSAKSVCCRVLHEVLFLSTCHDKNVSSIAHSEAERDTFLMKQSLMKVDSVKSNIASKHSTINGNYSLIWNKIVDMEWVHDPELGRGYLLYSVGNRIWRWEKGGGPIAIGRTLHLDNAGCRSNLYRKCHNEASTPVDVRDNMMVGAIAIQKERKSDSKPVLSIAEWGEGRVVRLESESGARTPLIIESPDVCSSQYQNQQQNDADHVHQVSSSSIINRPVRLSYNPERMLYTREGDLLVVIPPVICNSNVDNKLSSVASIIKFARATYVQPLQSLQVSRLAHAWSSMRDREVNYTVDALVPELWFQSEAIQAIMGIVTSPKHDSVFVSVKYNDGSIGILEIPLEETLSDENEGQDDDDIKDVRVQEDNIKRDAFPTASLRFNLTTLLLSSDKNISSDYAFSAYDIGDLVVSQSGTVFVAVSQIQGSLVESKIVILKENVGKSSSVVVSSIDLTNKEDFECKASIITALELGTDGYLYAAISIPANYGNDIYRIRTKEKRI